MKAELLCQAGHNLAEGPVWHDRAWWWVDINGGTLNRCELDGASPVSKPVGRRPGAAVPCEDGRWIVAHEEGFGFFDWDSGHLDTFNRCLAEFPHTRMNDGKCDPAGRFWAGGMMESDTGSAELYRVDASGNVSSHLKGLGCSNGLAWSLDASQFYYIDTPTSRIDLFDYDLASGAITNRRPFISIPAEAGWPDGMSIDTNGNLWLALWGGSAVQCYDGENGKVLERIETQATQTSSCCFGGPGGEYLLITSAWQGYDDARRKEEPLAGSLFIAQPGVSGMPPSRYIAQ